MCFSFTLQQEEHASGSGDSALQEVVLPAGLRALDADECRDHRERAGHHSRDHQRARRLDITCARRRRDTHTRTYYLIHVPKHTLLHSGAGKDLGL